jgi:hypothetical protein
VVAEAGVVRHLSSLCRVHVENNGVALIRRWMVCVFMVSVSLPALFDSVFPAHDALFSSFFGRDCDPHDLPLALLKSALAAVHDESHLEIRQSLDHGPEELHKLRISALWAVVCWYSVLVGSYHASPSPS